MKHQTARKAAPNNRNWSTRLAFGIAGLFTVIYGYGERLRGHEIYENRRGLDTSPDFVMFIGVLFVLVAVFPWGKRK